jgi:hypothetical protein
LTSASTWNSPRAARFAAVTAAASLLLLAAPRAARGGDEEGCLGCHGLSALAVREAGKTRSLAIAADVFDRSAHGDLGCRECHVDIASIPHGETRDVGCGQPCHGQSTGGKAYSHEGLYWEYAASSHGSAQAPRIGCLVCHPVPERRESEERDKLGEARRCASCHRGSAQVRAWFTDRHYLALAGGNARVPSCPDCHSAHRVRPAAAPESPVNPKRLAETCANGALAGDRRGACHAGLAPADVAGAAMNPLPRGRAGALSAVLTVFAGMLLLGLVARSGVGLVRGR